MANENETKSAAPPEAAPHAEAKGNARTLEGKIVSIRGDKLLMTGKDGKEYSHTLDKQVKITCDGASCNSSDLGAGGKIRVTLSKDDRNVLVGVEALDKQPNFAPLSV